MKNSNEKEIHLVILITDYSRKIVAAYSDISVAFNAVKAIEHDNRYGQRACVSSLNLDSFEEELKEGNKLFIVHYNNGGGGEIDHIKMADWEQFDYFEAFTGPSVYLTMDMSIGVWADTEEEAAEKAQGQHDNWVERNK